MTKKTTYQTLNLAELQNKEQAFMKDLVTSRLSMNVTSLSTASNLQNLLRELKVVKRLAAIHKKKANAAKVQQ